MRERRRASDKRSQGGITYLPRESDSVTKRRRAHDRLGVRGSKALGASNDHQIVRNAIEKRGECGDQRADILVRFERSYAHDVRLARRAVPNGLGCRWSILEPTCIHTIRRDREACSGWADEPQEFLASEFGASQDRRSATPQARR